MALLFILCLILLHCLASSAISSYEPPACFSNVEDCRSKLAHKGLTTLNNKYLLMIGDSLTRYQYLSLIYTLRHRRPPDVHMYPNLNENTHGEWHRFFKNTNAIMAPYEQCDCSYYSGRFFEHRRYYDPTWNVSVTYLMYRGFFMEGSNDTNSLYAPEPQGITAPQWNFQMKEYLTKQFKPRHVDYLVANVGFFGFHESIKPADFISWCQGLSDRVVWKTTTYGQFETPTKRLEDRGRMDIVDAEMCGTKHVHCMDTSWTVKVDQELDYWDSKHFNEPVYSILNDQLFDVLKGTPHAAKNSTSAARSLRHGV